MKNRSKLTLGAALLACLVIALPLSACSKNGAAQSGDTSSSAAGGTNGGGNSSSKRIIGKVTAIVGNQVTLAVGTLNRSGWGGGRQGSSSSAANSSAASSGTSSGLITMTGETQNVLIPVGMSIVQGGGGMGGGRFGGMPGGGTASGSQRPNFSGRSGGSGGQAAGGAYGGQQRTGGGTWQGGSAGTASRSGTNGAGAGTITKKTTDFSSIKTGMILEITEQPASSGSSYQVTQVRIISGT